MNNYLLRPQFDPEKRNPEKWLEWEWLIANGLGGYASNSIACIPTRKYHGFLVASLPKHGRTVMLDHLLESLILPGGQEVFLNNVEKPDGFIDLKGPSFLEDFYLEKGLPVWRYRVEGVILEKRVFMTHGQNTVHFIYSLLSDDEGLRLKLYPYMHFRPTTESLQTTFAKPYIVSINENRYEIVTEDFPALKMLLDSDVQFSLDRKQLADVFFRKEARRGYPSIGSVWTPGYFLVPLKKDEKRPSLLVSTESWEEIYAMNSFEALHAEYMRKELLLKNAPNTLKTDLGCQLIFAADQFIITPASRIQDKIRAKAAGDEVRTVIAGYHWFNDWGRDTMISLEGLTLCTGRFDEARWILRTFAYYVKNGLIPNMFPEGEKEGLYHTADASLWFFQALNAYLEKTGDRETLQFILPKLLEIYQAHIKGTHFGIHVDLQDGLLVQGQEGVQLTWMDAKVDNWVVTPRRGKAVEINALWYNALKILEGWLQQEGREDLGKEVAHVAAKARQAFNQKFWNEKKQYLFDVIEGEAGSDDALRPNQLLAISLKYPILDQMYWKQVFESSKEALFTPVGLRSLCRDHPDFKNRYGGDLHTRDAAYHQGTVWSWLIGPYIDVWLKVYPEEKEAAKLVVNGFYHHLKEAGIGYISEIFDATEPYHPRGCIAQAWSIAELLRSLAKVS